MMFEEQFEIFKQQFQKTGPHRFDEEFAIQVCMTDADCGGIFYVAFINGVFAVEPYDYYDHSAALTTTADVFARYITGKRVLKAQLGITGKEAHVKLLQGLAKEKAEVSAKKPVARKATKKASAPAKSRTKRTVADKPAQKGKNQPKGKK